MNVIEVVILEHTLVLPLYPNATIASITQDALQEFQSFNFKKAPQKVLYTKDGRGRILSNNLPLSPTYLEGNSKIEVVIQDYSDQDSLSPVDLEKLYRSWQAWILRQIKDHVEQSVYREVPTIPHEILMNVVKEISMVTIESLQITCLSIYRLLLLKFPSTQIIMNAAEGISSIFMTSSISNVLEYALDCFKDLSPLQLKLFECNKYMKTMLQTSLETHLSRFQAFPDIQSKLFEKFASIMTLLQDEELSKVFAQFQKKREELNNTTLLSDTTTTPHQTPRTDEIGIEEGLLKVENATRKVVNLTRLQSLILSEDTKIRIYSLEKLKKYLQQATAATTSLFNNQEDGKIQNEEISNVNSPMKDTEKGLVLQLQTEKEMISLLKTLFQAMKNSIKARPTTSSTTTNATSNTTSTNTQFFKSLSNLSTAGRLITLAYHSPDTDKHSLMLTVDCLCMLLQYTPDITAGELLTQQEQHHHLINYQQTSPKRHNILLGTWFHNIHKIFVIVGKDWYRLLFTLSHSYEYIALGNHSIPLSTYTNDIKDNTSNSLEAVDYELHKIAENTAYMFSLIVIHGMQYSWISCSLQLENNVLMKYINVNQINYRLYMALTYVLYLLKKCHGELLMVGKTAEERKNSGVEVVASVKQGGSRNNTAADQSQQQHIIEQLLELCTMQQYLILKQLWWWSMQQEESNFFIRRLGFKILSQLTLMNTLNYYLWKLEPMPKLLEALTKCYHLKGQTKRIKFLQKDKHQPTSHGWLSGEEEGNLIDDELDEFEDDDEDDEHHGSDGFGGWSKENDTSDQPIPNIKIDYMQIRLILKTILNLIQSSSSANFFPKDHYPQLKEYLTSLSIGISLNNPLASDDNDEEDDFLSSPEQSHPRRSFSTMPLKDVANRDRIVYMYYELLTEILSTTS